MKYFDTHVHFFPDKLAGKALPRLREISQCPTYTDGTRGDTLAKFAQWGCVGGMVLHIATNAHQQTSVNRFAVESQGDGLYCFGSVYPYAENAIEAMGAIKEAGLHGIKLHPDYQEFFIGDEAALPLADKPNVYFDTAFASHFLDVARFTELVKLRGADHVLFATDSPWSTLPAEKALLDAADLTPAEKEAIAWKNAEELFGISI